MTPPSRRPRRRRWSRGALGRWLLLVLGVFAVVLLVRDAGWPRVRDTIFETAPWLPLILALEVLWVSCDSFALIGLYGKDRRLVPIRDWVRSAILAYAIMILLPAGRAGGEVARATILSRRSGGRAIAYSAQLQASVLIANALITLPCWVAVMREVGLDTRSASSSS
ncbi:MAG: hypothetical protein HC923_05650 [Myxococcales bacterium]|nr:hypothetical protein [Myxococcales bacterium]